MMVYVAPSLFENCEIDFCSDKGLFGLEYVDDVMLLSVHPGTLQIFTTCLR